MQRERHSNWVDLKLSQDFDNDSSGVINLQIMVNLIQQKYQGFVGKFLSDFFRKSSDSSERSLLEMAR